MPTSVNSRLKILSETLGSNAAPSRHRLSAISSRPLTCAAISTARAVGCNAAARGERTGDRRSAPQQPGQHLADGRLGCLEPLGGARNAPLAEHRVEHPQIAEVDIGRFHSWHTKHSLVDMDEASRFAILQSKTK